MPELFWTEIKRSGWDNYIKPAAEADFSRVEIVIIRTRTTIQADFFSRLPVLTLIIRAGSGYDNIDLKAALKNQVRVCTTPEVNKTAAFEHTVSLILGLIKGHQIGKEAVSRGKWKQSCPRNWEVSDLKALIVGSGRIGTLVAETLESWGAEIGIVDPYLDEVKKERWREQILDYSSGLGWCNLVTFHCPLSWETRNYFSLESLSLLTHPLWVVNTSRGAVVNESALIKGLQEKLILGAALDVFAREPYSSKEMTSYNNVYLTPHTGAYTVKAEERLIDQTLKAWYEFCVNSNLLNEVNYRFYNEKIGL